MELFEENYILMDLIWRFQIKIYMQTTFSTVMVIFLRSVYANKKPFPSRTLIYYNTSTSLDRTNILYKK